MAKSEEEIRREQARARLEQRRARQQGARSRQPAARPRKAATPRKSARPRQTAALPISPKLLVVAGLAALLIIGLVILAARGCVPSEGEGSLPTEGANTDVAANEATDSASSSAIDQEALADIMGEDLAMQMVVVAKTNPDVAWIAANPDAVGVDGAKAQRKLLKLATLEPAAVAFVREYLDSYPAETADPCDALPADVDIPLLMQWDQRWAYTVYSSAAFGQTGCCPTCLAMVYQGITRKTDLSPYDMGQLSKENGFMARYAGTDGNFLISVGGKLGLDVDDISATASNITDELAAGNVLIANVGPGDFTEGGHYIVLTGLDPNGNVIVNDPYSVVKSEQVWDAGVIADQTKRLFVFYR